jgi:hypothetical protein
MLPRPAALALFGVFAASWVWDLGDRAPVGVRIVGGIALMLILVDAIVDWRQEKRDQDAHADS